MTVLPSLYPEGNKKNACTKVRYKVAQWVALRANFQRLMKIKHN